MKNDNENDNENNENKNVNDNLSSIDIEDIKTVLFFCFFYERYLKCKKHKQKHYNIHKQKHFK